MIKLRMPWKREEMLGRDRMLVWQARESRKDWWIGILTVGMVALAVATTAWFMVEAANIKARATREAADRQLQFQEKYLIPPSTADTAGSQPK